MQLSSPAVTAGGSTLLDRRGQAYQPAVATWLKPFLALIFLAFALLSATGLYLLATRLLEVWTGRSHVTATWFWILLAHIGGGAVIILPFLFFGLTHWASARQRKNRRAVSLGKSLFFTGIIICVSGLALIQLHDNIKIPSDTVQRWIVYGIHVGSPVIGIILYVLHRRAGPDIKWGWGYGWGGAMAVMLAGTVYLHSHDPRNLPTPKEGDKYFHPSASRTKDGKFVSAETFMMDSYCMKCHEDIYNDHLHSAHKFSSFNNPAYLFSVRETRRVGLERDKSTRASRWCAGCHDPVPFFSGQFDDPNFDDVNNPTAHAGITCTVCHAMTHVNSAKGNGDYIIEEPLHYPFAKSDNKLLQYINNQMVKAKPDFHKQTFLKPFHKTAEFCSTCHKVSLPVELNHYKEFTRGQNHYDSYLLSGVSGHGVRSWYYPPEAKTNCAQCHMPLKPSNDFGSKDFDNTGIRKVHDHSFPGANTGLPWMLSLDKDRFNEGPHSVAGLRRAALVQADFLRGVDPEGKDRKLRIDLFAVKEGGNIDGLLHVLRPQLPRLKPGEKYLVEVVVRTVNVGHPFTQGTVDSNEIWVHFQAKQKEKIVGESGQMINKPTSKGEKRLPDVEGVDGERPFVVLDDRPVDPWAHFVNVLLLDKDGNRINRRNPQDIFTPLYNHQIPPGAGQLVHYVLDVPKLDAMPKNNEGKPEPIKLSTRLRYRKFDFEYMAIVHGKDGKPDESAVPGLPVVDLCEDSVLLPVEGGTDVPAQTSAIKPAWHRWNDYGIGNLNEGGPFEKKGNQLQALAAFKEVEKLGEAATDEVGKAAQGIGLLNQARVLEERGWLNNRAGQEGAVDVLKKLQACEPQPPWWTVAWVTARVNAQNGHLEAAIADLKKIRDPENQQRLRKFDFRLDYTVNNELADLYFRLSQNRAQDRQRRDELLNLAIETFETTLTVDPEDLDAQYGLFQIYDQMASSLKTRVKENPSANTEQLKQRIAAVLESDKLAIFKDGDASDQARIGAAQHLSNILVALGNPKLYMQKEAIWLPLAEKLRKEAGEVYRAESGQVRQAAALLLAHAHRILHALFKPDDDAIGKAESGYAAKIVQAGKVSDVHLAGERGSKDRVLYPTTEEQKEELRRRVLQKEK